MYKKSAQRMMDKENIAKAYAAIDTSGIVKRVSNIFPSNNCTIETKTDAHRYLMNSDHKARFIAEHGDVVVEYDSRFKVWRVPAFADDIAAYCKMKAAHCARYGSN